MKNRKEEASLILSKVNGYSPVEAETKEDIEELKLQEVAEKRISTINQMKLLLKWTILKR